MKWSRILFAFALGCLGAVIFLQQDERFIKAVEDQLKYAFEKTFDCVVIDAQISKLNLLRGVIIAHNVKVQARDGFCWTWSATTVKIKSSWLYLCAHHKIGLAIDLVGVQATSTIVDGRLAIIDHLEKIISGAPGLPIMLRALSLRDTHCQLVLGPLNIQMLFDAELVQHTGQQIDLSLTVHSGWLRTSSESCVAENIQARLYMGKKKGAPVAEGEGLISAVSPYVPGGKISAAFGIKKNKVRWVLKDADNKQIVTAQAQIENTNSFAMQLHGGIYLADYSSSVGEIPFCADAHLQADFSYEQQESGKQATAHLVLTGTHIGTITSDLLFKDTTLKGSINALTAKVGRWSGVGQYDAATGEGNAVLRLRNEVPLFSTGFKIVPSQTALYLTAKKDNPFKIAYQFALFDMLKNETALLRGSGQLTQEQSVFDLATEHGICSMQIDYKDQFTACAQYTSASGKKLLTFAVDGQQKMDASVDYQLIRAMVRRLFGVDANGQGILTAQATVKNGRLSGAFCLQDACIRLVPSYNFIKNVQASFNLDLATARCTLEKGLVELHGGNLAIPRAVLSLSADGNINFLHMPLKVSKAVITLYKECFVQLSGMLVLSKREENSRITGCLLIDKGQLKKNIFSLIASRQLLEPVTFPFGNTIFDGQLHLTVATQKPLSIKTSFLDTQADLSLLINGTIAEPAVSGKISLYRGTLAFPYRPLYITHGALHFTPPRLTDPDILFVAKGRVRHFDVTLRVGGSLDHPHVSLESTPPLTDEQIITLLLIGSESGAFSLIMPTLIMNNIQHLLFGPEQSLKKLETYFKSLLSPLKNIRIVPSFTDQSGRGGLRGAIEVDVSDQLHAVIQKNFSQPEDTKFEVEYLATDDLTLRAIKDERGDLGGEFELRWKF